MSAPPENTPPKNTPPMSDSGSFEPGLSEARILRVIREALDQEQKRPAAGADPVLLGIGDDAAVLDLTQNPTVLSIDTQDEGHDYHLRWPSGYETRGFELGWKSAAQNLADIAAMGARPVALLISLTLTPRQDLEFIADIARGYAVACRELGAPECRVVGGDLGRGERLSATVTAVGAAGDRVLRRDGARPGDRMILMGTVGRAAAGLDLLLRSDTTAWGPVPQEGTGHREGSGLEDLAASQLRPCPPLAAAEQLIEAGARACLDVSDGLLRDAGRIAEASGVRADLDPRALRELAEPLHQAGQELGEDPLKWVLTGGEDHGLLAALPPDRPLPEGARAIGSWREADESIGPVSIGGRAPETTLGWDHFADEDRLQHRGDEAVARGLRAGAARGRGAAERPERLPGS